MWLCFALAFLQAHSLSLDFDVVHILWPQSTLIQSTVIEENYLLDDKIGRRFETKCVTHREKSTKKLTK